MGGRGKKGIVRKRARKVPPLPENVKQKLQSGRGDRVTSKSLGLDTIRQKAPTFDRKTRTAKKNLDISKLKISAGNLSKSSILRLERDLAGGIRRKGVTAITVAPVKGKPGQYVVVDNKRGSGNNRIAYLKLAGYTGKVYVNVVSAGRRNLTNREKARRAAKKARK